MKRRSTKTVQESADNWKCSRRTAVSTTTSTAITTGRSTTTTTTTSQAASSADVTAAPAATAAAPAGSARQRRFTAKRALEMLQSLPDTDSGSDDSETNDERSDSSVQPAHRTTTMMSTAKLTQKAPAEQRSLFHRPKQPQTQMDRQQPKMGQSGKL